VRANLTKRAQQRSVVASECTRVTRYTRFKLFGSAILTLNRRRPRALLARASVTRPISRVSKTREPADVRETAELTELLYGELRRIAAGYLRSEHAGHTLQPTALVHEAFLRLSKQHVEWNDRAHFLAVAANTMRRVLVDHERKRSASKRDGGLRVTMEESAPDSAGDDRALELLALDDALVRLASLDLRTARVVELRFFGGLSVEEAAAVLKISPASVKRDWSFARAWLGRELRGTHDSA
jgi:RNA polymerase sigma factor (TIGR02999 family)